MKRRSFLILSAGTVAGLAGLRLPPAKPVAAAVATLPRAPISLAAYLRANPALRAAWEKTVEPPMIPYLPTERELEWQAKKNKR